MRVFSEVVCDRLYVNMLIRFGKLRQTVHASANRQIWAHRRSFFLFMPITSDLLASLKPLLIAMHISHFGVWTPREPFLRWSLREFLRSSSEGEQQRRDDNKCNNQPWNSETPLIFHKLLRYPLTSAADEPTHFIPLFWSTPIIIPRPMRTMVSTGINSSS